MYMNNPELMKFLQKRSEQSKVVWNQCWQPPLNFFSLFQKCKTVIERDAKILTAGNGGSAAQAIHFATEFISKCKLDHEPWGAISLNSSISDLTAISNDYSYDFVFSRPLKALAKNDDVVILFTTSGKSKNIINCYNYAKLHDIAVYVFTGENQSEFINSDCIAVPSSYTPLVQEVHLYWAHLLVEMLES